MSYSDLFKVSYEYAIQAMTELAIPRGSEGKVLLVPVSITANNYDKDVNYRREFTLVLYRPMNYCFVGMVEGSENSLQDGQDIHYETYHDSCWRDGINRLIREQGHSIYEEAEKDGVHKDLTVFNTFGFFDPRVIEGCVDMYGPSRTAKFKEIKKMKND